MARRKKGASGARAEADEGAAARAAIVSFLRRLADDIEAGRVPNVEIPPLSRGNIEFSEDEGYRFHPKTVSRLRGDVVKSLKTITALVYGAARALDHLDAGLTMTKRDFYYMHKVDRLRGTIFPKDQRETDARIVLLELLLGLPREAFAITSDPRGWIYGAIEIEDRSGRKIRADRVGEMGYSVPPRPENIKFGKIDVKAVVAVEKVGPAKNMIELGIPEEYGIGVAILHGQPSRSMRRFLRMLADEGVPIAVLTDLSPWSLRIASSVIYNSMNSAHIPLLATPSAQFIGIHTKDVEDGMFADYQFALEPLTPSDLKAAEENRNIPSLQGEFWRRENEWFLRHKKKAEIEIFKAMSPTARELKELFVQYLREKLDEHLGVSV